MGLQVFKTYFIFNIILLFSFSISVNSLLHIEIINILFYFLFHLTFIYFLFYYYHYTHYILGFIYGILFDIILLNSIGSHLISFMVILSIYLLFKKYLLLLTSNQISLIIFISLNLILYIEILLSYFLNNIYFTISHLFNYLVISIIIFIPIVTILNKLNK